LNSLRRLGDFEGRILTKEEYELCVGYAGRGKDVQLGIMEGNLRRVRGVLEGRVCEMKEGEDKKEEGEDEGGMKIKLPPDGLGLLPVGKLVNVGNGPTNAEIFKQVYNGL